MGIGISSGNKTNCTLHEDKSAISYGYYINAEDKVSNVNSSAKFERYDYKFFKLDTVCIMLDLNKGQLSFVVNNGVSVGIAFDNVVFCITD